MGKEELGKVQRDPLFMALTRPATIAGVPYDFAIMNLLIWMITYINTKDFMLAAAGGGICHIFGIFLANNEPRFIEIFKIWMLTVPTCVNRGYHGNTCSYDLY